MNETYVKVKCSICENVDIERHYSRRNQKNTCFSCRAWLKHLNYLKNKHARNRS